jgi:hypothetical protein
MTIIDDICACLHRVKVVFLHSFDNGFLGNNLVFPHNDTLVLLLVLVKVVPLAGTDLRDFETDLGVNVQDVPDYVTGFS